ncbi:MAG: adenylate/guanylate cyclase domain-containing protein [Candidatus Binatia bacterium]
MWKKRILLVDNEPSFTRMVKIHLEKAGAYEVREENIGAEALDAARQFNPDLIFLDVIMPDMNGGDVALQIEADKDLKNTPIVFLTGSAPEKRQYVIRDRPFIAKPVSAKKLIDCIDQYTPSIPHSPTSSDSTGPRMGTGGLVTILFTDMEGSTSLTQRLGDARAQEVLRLHNGIVREALGAHGGALIKHTGDGIMASLTSTSRALDCAIAIQRAFARYNESNSPVPIRVRIGLNTGEPVAEDQDLFGTVVQVAARICAHAEPGQILATMVVRELVAGKKFMFVDRGAVALRGFEEITQLYEVKWRQEV